MSKTKVVVLMATYNDWESAAELLPKIDHELSAMGATGHVVIVDDGSVTVAGKERIPASPLSAITQVDCVNLFRNQGNQRAIAIGLAYCDANTAGDYLVIMDSDHEDKPEYIPELVKACIENDDAAIVFAERSERSEALSFRFFYGVYQRLYKVLTGMKISIGNFSAIPWPLVKRIANVAELWSHFPAAIMRARFPFKTIRSERGKRVHGQSKMSLIPLVLHALSGFTVHAETIGARTLILALVLGLGVLAMVGVFLGIRLFTDIPVLGWTSQFISLLVIIVFQILITAVIMVFMVISIRMQVPMIPALEFEKFILDAGRIFPTAGKAGQSRRNTIS